jgi:hypothetical protein
LGGRKVRLGGVGKSDLRERKVRLWTTEGKIREAGHRGKSDLRRRKVRFEEEEESQTWEGGKSNLRRKKGKSDFEGGNSDLRRTKVRLGRGENQTWSKSDLRRRKGRRRLGVRFVKLKSAPILCREIIFIFLKILGNLNPVRGYMQIEVFPKVKFIYHCLQKLQ